MTVAPRLRILHLAFQDPRQPGSGGGAVRTREIGARLSERHDIEVVTAGWRGARERVEDGLRWRHTPALKGRASSLSYFAAVPLLARRRDVDLVVEDFAAPFSTLGLPRFARAPTLGVVQWLFAAEKSAQYHLPFGRVEEWGLRQHHTLIAVSEGLGQELRRRVPGADVHVVENGVTHDADPSDSRAALPAVPARYLLFLGRLEIAQKGLDVLLEALAAPPLARREEPVELVLAGDGPDEGVLRALADRLGLGDRLHWVGRVGGSAKASLLAGASAVVVPSRYETFGMVAAEAMAAGTAVVASDIPCLRDVVAGGGGVVVPPEDRSALASALAGLLDDAPRTRLMGRRGAFHAQRYDWDRLAAAQEAVYLDVVGRHAADGRR